MVHAERLIKNVNPVMDDAGPRASSVVLFLSDTFLLYTTNRVTQPTELATKYNVLYQARF